MSYIDRERLLQDIEETIRISGRPDNVRNGEMRGVNKVVDRIKAAPAEDVEPVVHAHWYLVEHTLPTQTYRCSNCGRSIKERPGIDVKKSFPYCHCGAKMDGEEV